jgi:hypothetical protein
VLLLQELAALEEAEEEAREPLDISWPKGDCRKQISYVCLFPIMIVLYMTLPDTRTPRGKKFFVWGFLGSILWIAIFSYFMVWWADRTGETFGIAPEVKRHAHPFQLHIHSFIPSDLSSQSFLKLKKYSNHTTHNI